MNFNYVVTGSSKGLGNSVAKLLLNKGHTVYGFSRSSNESLLEFTNFIEHLGHVESEASVASLFHNFNSDVPLHGVVHAAGKYGPFGRVSDVSIQEWKSNIDVNLLGTFLCIRGASMIFDQQGFGNFVGLSGGGATSPMPRITSYAASKTGVVRLIESVARDYDGKRVSFNAVAPGLMDTEMLDEVLRSGPDLVGKDFYNRMQEFKQSGIDSKDKATELICALLGIKDGKPTGKLISAIWDNWEELFLSDSYYNNDEMHTLRRIN